MMLLSVFFTSSHDVPHCLLASNLIDSIRGPPCWCVDKLLVFDATKAADKLFMHLSVLDERKQAHYGYFIEFLSKIKLRDLLGPRRTEKHFVSGR